MEPDVSVIPVVSFSFSNGSFVSDASYIKREL
jgi:hypothetical protein